MKSLDFDTRSKIAKECINRVCESAGLKTSDKKKKIDKRFSMISNEPILENAGENVNLTINNSYLNLSVMETGKQIAKHDMPMISFAARGDSETLDFIAYVAKDSKHRCCFVLECGGGLAQDVIETIGDAFDLRFKEYLKKTPKGFQDSLIRNRNNETSTVLNYEHDPTDYYNDLPPDIKSKSKLMDSQPNLIDLNTDLSLEPIPSLEEKIDHQYVNCNGSDSISTYLNGDKEDNESTYSIFGASCLPSSFLSNNNNNNIKDPFDMQPFLSTLDTVIKANNNSSTIKSTTTPFKSEANSSLNNNNLLNELNGKHENNNDLLKNEIWFHGSISRKESEILVASDGDFLVRQSQGCLGQFVLTGMQGGVRKHLLLVDQMGVVRTKDRTFNSVSHLINYHMNNGLPIISAESTIVLRNPVKVRKID